MVAGPRSPKIQHSSATPRAYRASVLATGRVVGHVELLGGARMFCAGTRAGRARSARALRRARALSGACAVPVYAKTLAVTMAWQNCGRAAAMFAACSAAHSDCGDIPGLKLRFVGAGEDSGFLFLGRCGARSACTAGARKQFRTANDGARFGGLGFERGFDTSGMTGAVEGCVRRPEITFRAFSFFRQQSAARRAGRNGCAAGAQCCFLLRSFLPEPILPSLKSYFKN